MHLQNWAWNGRRRCAIMRLMQEVTDYPLMWPAGKPRTASPGPSPFRPRTYFAAARAVVHELMRAGAEKIVISSNLRTRSDGLPYSRQRDPQDPGVAVYFTLDGEPHALACDRWRRVEHNLWAISKHVEALRGQERWGVGSTAQAFAGFRRIEATAGGETPWDILGIKREGATPALIERAFRERALRAHPDHGGTDAEMARLIGARKLAMEGMA